MNCHLSWEAVFGYFVIGLRESGYQFAEIVPIFDETKVWINQISETDAEKIYADFLERIEGGLL